MPPSRRLTVALAVLGALVLRVFIAGRFAPQTDIERDIASEVRHGIRALSVRTAELLQLDPLSEAPPCAERWDGPSVMRVAERLPTLPMSVSSENMTTNYPGVLAFSNVCIHPLTDLMFALGPDPPLGMQISRTFLRGRLQQTPRSFINEPCLWLPGTTLQVRAARLPPMRPPRD